MTLHDRIALFADTLEMHLALNNRDQYKPDLSATDVIVEGLTPFVLELLAEERRCCAEEEAVRMASLRFNQWEND